MNKKKKILLIIPCVPYPLNSGGNQAFFNMTDRLREKLEVSLLLSIKPHRELKQVEALKSLWGNVTFYIHHQTEEKKSSDNGLGYALLSWMHKFSAHKLAKLKGKDDLIRRKSTLFESCDETFSSDFCDFVYNVTRKGFDVIQVEFFQYLPLFYLFPPEPKTIFVHHELRYIRNEGEIKLFKEKTLADWMKFYLAKEYERGTLAQYNYILALTEVDVQLLSSLINKPTTQIIASPAAIIKNISEENNEFVPATNRLTFVGSEHHFPNQDAIIWFCNEVVPHLRNMNFPFTIELIGQWKKKHILPYINQVSELKIMGFVEKLEDTLRGSISVVPVRIGSGMRIKILDTIMAPAPLITTTKGVEGIDLRNGIDCLIADSPQEFAECIVKLFKDQNLQKGMTINALSRLQSIYNPQKMIEKRCEIYDTLLQV